MTTFKNQHRPTVLLVGNFLSATRGTRGVCEDLALRLKAADWSVITTSSCPGRLRRLVDFLLTVWRCRNQYHVAHVDVYSGLAFVWAELVCWALRIVKKPYVLTLRGGNLPSFAQKRGERVLRLLQSSSIVTTPSAYLFEQMHPYRKELVLLPNPLDLGKYSFKHRAHPAPKLVWLRAFHDIYNPSLAVQVVALLVRDLPAVQLSMMGPDSRDGSLEETKKLATQLGVMDRLTCTGPVAKLDVPHLLNQGDILLNTPRVDNTPVSVLEAMACGLCVVSTNVGGIPYLLEHEGDALLVPTDDAAAMAQAVRRLLTEDGLAEQLSRNGRRKAEQLDWSIVLPRWQQLLIGLSENT
jgi:glycosyltransferase involved in cell wall biosynthesis